MTWQSRHSNATGAMCGKPGPVAGVTLVAVEGPGGCKSPDVGVVRDLVVVVEDERVEDALADAPALERVVTSETWGVDANVGTDAAGARAGPLEADAAAEGNGRPLP